MRFEIDIDYPMEKIEASARRMRARKQFTYVDRVPVGFILVPRYFTPIFQIPYCELFKDAQTQFYWQLQFAKYRWENIPEDLERTEPVVNLQPYFDNVVDSEPFGAEVIWPENETLHACPTITSVEQMEAFEIPPMDQGLWGRLRQWWATYRALAADTRVTFAGRPGRVEVPLLGIGGLGPHMIAVDLVGTDFYWWMIEYEDACHRFLRKIAEGLIQQERYCRTIDPRPRTAMGLAEDTSTIMSEDQFRQFTVPYDRMIYEAVLDSPTAWRSMHMCGCSEHLHAAMVDELHIKGFDGFGYQVDPKVAAEQLARRGVALFGNINPMLMREGTSEQVRQTCLEALQAMAPYGGLMLGDGANVCPGTPLENLAALTEAAKAYGLGNKPLPERERII